MKKLVLGLVLFTPSVFVSANDCYDSWYQRNLIFAERGYCFESNLGKEVFKGFQCSTHSPKFSADEKKIIEQIKAKERQLNCNINTALTKTNDSNISSSSAEVAAENKVNNAEDKTTAVHSADLTMTADELVAAEHGNKARFMRDIVGKTVKVTGRVKVIQEKYFTLEASGSLSGWDVFTSNKNTLADLNVGQMVTMTCPVTDTVFIGGNSKCD